MNTAPSLAMTDDELAHVERVIEHGNRTAARLTVVTRAARERTRQRWAGVIDAGTLQDGHVALVTRVA